MRILTPCALMCRDVISERPDHKFPRVRTPSLGNFRALFRSSHEGMFDATFLQSHRLSASEEKLRKEGKLRNMLNHEENRMQSQQNSAKIQPHWHAEKGSPQSAKRAKLSKTEQNSNRRRMQKKDHHRVQKEQNRAKFEAPSYAESGRLQNAKPPKPTNRKTPKKNEPKNRTP